ncbi:DoxX family protein [Flavobacterium acetivorans]|uniref:DoxX family protein n=1 Tax=Flavobacterium acetivorans TaxID=2893883 RepID=UPI001E42122C|nr:DoxX family protein [Flavobacterium sp. F-29]UFH34909.1 DoxX family protein [Flavobacterium sp. F-29]
MKIKANIKQNYIDIISYLFIVLFTYAAVNKLLDFENFQVQLGQSPLLSAFAGWVSWGVPIVELIIALLLVFPKYRLAGLLAAFSLMVMFTAYIIIILNFSSFVPCSCGGILEKMSWTQHLVFNIAFILLAAAGILILRRGVPEGRLISTPAALANTFSLSLFFSIGIVVMLFMWSEDIIHHRNNFIRRFPHHPTTLIHQSDLKLNSYYIAGLDSSHIYLGNFTAPLHLRVLDRSLNTIRENEVALSNLNLAFRSPRIHVFSNEYYFVDGTVPVIFNGKAEESQTVQNPTKAFFSLAIPVDPKTFVIRARDSKTNEHILGILSIGDSANVKLSKDLLVKQIDGIFDTDGMLLYNEQLKKIIYIYYYRNQFIVTNDKLKDGFTGNTIDTISKAQIKISYVSSKKASKFSSPPLVVNKKATTFGKYLFVHSGLMGKFEPENTWKKSSVIDVYDLVKKTYAFSFYISNRGKDQLSDFRVYGDKLVCLIGNHITIYKLDGLAFDSSKANDFKINPK